MLLARRGLGLFKAALQGVGQQQPRVAICCEQILPPAFTTSSALKDNIEIIRSRIFGNHIGNGLRSGRKVLRKKLIGDKIANYYPEPISKLDPMFVDTTIERKKTKLDKLKRRGKAPPKKGQGRRASKRR